MTIVYTVGEISNNKIYTEQGWKMASVYTVGECIYCWRDKKI